MTDEPRYRKLLRWYPKPWRERNGDALLGVMLDEAERCGRTGPSWGERWSAFAHGVGMRLDAALAWRLAIVVVVLNCGGLLWFFFVPEELRPWNLVLAMMLLTAAAPVLLIISFAAVVRERGLLLDPHVLLAACAGVLASTAAGLAWVSWSIGYYAAEAYEPVPLAGQLFQPLVLCAIPLSVVAVCIAADGMSRLQKLPRPVRLLIGTGAGVLVIPLIVPVPLPLSPHVTVLAVVMMVLVGRQPRTRCTPMGAVYPSGMRLARFLGFVSVVLGVVGVGCSMVGLGDLRRGGELLTRGVQILCVAVWPCAAAIGMLVAAREPTGSRASLNVWGPAVLVSASSAVIAVAFEVASPGSGDAIVHAFRISGVIGGAAVAWMLITWLRLPGYQRVMSGIVVGLGYAAIIGMLAWSLLLLVAPVLGAVVAFRRSPRPAPDRAQPR